MTHGQFVKIVKKTWRAYGLSGYSSQPSGLPDLLVMLDGRPHFCEIKIDNDRLSDNQKYFLKLDSQALVLWLRTTDNMLLFYSNCVSNNMNKEAEKLALAINAKLECRHIDSILDKK